MLVGKRKVEAKLIMKLTSKSDADILGLVLSEKTEIAKSLGGAEALQGL